MKIALFILSLVMAGFYCQAQSSDTSKIEQYCEIAFYQDKWANFFNRTEVDMGNLNEHYVDSALIYVSSNLKKFRSPVSILNYLGRAGWKLVNAYATKKPDNDIFSHYVFKKEFLLTDDIANIPVVSK